MCQKIPPNDLSTDEYDQWRLASLLIDEKKYLEAKEILDRLLCRDIPIAKIYAHRGFVNYRLQNYLDAIIDFTRAIEQKPYAKNTLFLRGRCFEELKKYQSAIENYDAVLTIDPKTADAYAQKGYCLEQMGLFKQAKLAYETALIIDPNESLALISLKQLSDQ